MLLLDVIFTWFLLLCVDFSACFDSWCFCWFIVALFVLLVLVIA